MIIRDMRARTEKLCVMLKTQRGTEPSGKVDNAYVNMYCIKRKDLHELFLRYNKQQSFSVSS